MKNRGKGIAKRRSAVRKPLVAFHIFCEGANTEKDYLSDFMKTVDQNNVKVFYHGPNGVPSSVVKSAIDFAKSRGLIKNKRRKKIDSFEENDKVVAVFDRDEHPCYNQAISIGNASEIICVYSDPCFELWISLHFDIHDAPYHRHEIQKAVKGFLPDYDPKSGKTANFSEAIVNIGVAENRAFRQRKKRIEENNPNGNPSTNFDQLTIAIRSASKGPLKP